MLIKFRFWLPLQSLSYIQTPPLEPSILAFSFRAASTAREDVTSILSGHVKIWKCLISTRTFGGTVLAVALVFVIPSCIC
jgi:hypothetical protein